MNKEDQPGEVVAVARGVLERAAPDQLPEFEVYATAWLADPRRAMRPEGGGDGPLSHGLGTELPNLAPLVLYVAHHVLDAGFEIGVGETVRRAWALARRRRERRGKAATPVETRSPQDIREKAIEAGEKFGARTQDVTLVANIIVLVLTGETSSAPVPPNPEPRSENPEES